MRLVHRRARGRCRGSRRHRRVRAGGVVTPGLLLTVISLGGCGDDQARRTYDADAVAGCISGRSGTLLTDPLNDRPVNFRLSPALRRQAAQDPTTRDASILPRRTAFAAFLGSDVTFVPPGFDDSGFVPAAFVFFDSAEAAGAHARDADARHGNVLIVFHGEPTEAQRNFIAGCF